MEKRHENVKISLFFSIVIRLRIVSRISELSSYRTSNDEAWDIPGNKGQLSAEAEERRCGRGHNTCTIQLRQDGRSEAGNEISIPARLAGGVSVSGEGDVCVRGDRRNRCLLLRDARPGVRSRLCSKFKVNKIIHLNNSQNNFTTCCVNIATPY